MHALVTKIIMFEILIDADMLLDALLNRVWDTDDLIDIWDVLKFGKIQGYITDIGFNLSIDIISKIQNTNAAEIVALAIQSRVIVYDVTVENLHIARRIQTADYESAVEIACCAQYSLGAIITHRPQDFCCSDAITLSITELLSRQNLETALTNNIFILSGPTSDIKALGQTLHTRQLGRIKQIHSSVPISLPGFSLQNMELSGENLERMDFACSRMISAKFMGSLLRGANFSDARLYEADFRHTDLESTDFDRAYLLHANLVEANLKYSHAKQSDFQFADLRAANLDSANWDNANLRRADLRNATLKHSFFNNVNFDQTFLNNACLIGANLFGATFRNASLRNANLRSANLRHVDFRGADLSGACFRNCNLDGADLRDTLLDKTDFTGTDLTRTRLSCPLLESCYQESSSYRV